MMRKLLIPAVALLALAGGAAFWAYGQADDGAEAGVEVVRWGNVTVSVPEGSGVTATQGFAPAEIKPPDGGQVLILDKGESSLVIDADTGEVLEDGVMDADRTTMGQVLATLEVSHLDETTAPWPYGDSLPLKPRERLGNITFIPPDPASGLTIYFGISDGAEGGHYFLQLTNGRSTIGIDVETGDISATKVAAEDKEAFDRFLSEIGYAVPGQ